SREMIARTFSNGSGAARGRETKAPAWASPSSAKPCERIAAVGASQTIRAEAPCSPSRFRLLTWERRRWPARAAPEATHDSCVPASPADQPRVRSGRGDILGLIIIIIIVVGGPKATRLRVDGHFAGLPIQGTGRFDISAVARDDDVRPSV